MRLAIISAGLFLVSYIAVNRGLGPHPLSLVVPLLVAVGTAVGARWLMRRGQNASTRRAVLEEDLLARDVPPQRHVPPSPPRSSGGKARKLF